MAVLASPNGSALVLEDRQFLIEDPLLENLIQLTQEPRNVSDLTARLSSQAEPAEILGAIQALCEHRILVDHLPRYTQRDLQAFWDIGSPANALGPLSITCLVPDFSRQLESLIQANGVVVQPDSPSLLLITNDYLRPEIDGLVKGKGSTLLAKPVGNELWIGPRLSKGGTLCWECLAYWLRLRRWPELFITGLNSEEPPVVASVACLPGTSAAGSALIVQAATLFAAGSLHFEDSLWTFDFHSFASRSFPIAPRRNCPVCRSADDRRVYAALSSARTGILKDVQTSDGLVGHVFLTHGEVFLPLGMPGIRQPQRPDSVDGKSRDPAEALHHCTMEAVERYSSVFVGDENIVYRRSQELDAVRPDELLLFSESQMCARDEWNADPNGYGVPEPFDPTIPTAWAAAESLVDGSLKYVPAGCVWLWYPFRNEPVYNFADTNGCAAGSTREDAFVHALLELIERDALGIWWYNRVRRPGVSAAHLEDTELWQASQFFAAHDRSLEILDLTNDIEIPVWVAISADSKGRNIYCGSAADLCPVSAARRAVAELIQFWYWEQRLGVRPERHIWLATGNLEEHSYLTAERRAPLQPGPSRTAAESLAVCVSAIKRVGLAAYSIDLTRPELGIPVVRVVCPGLRHYGPRFAPGRLFDVPVKLGWLPAPRIESELNPALCVL